MKAKLLARKIWMVTAFVLVHVVLVFALVFAFKLLGTAWLWLFVWNPWVGGAALMSAVIVYFNRDELKRELKNLLIEELERK